MRHQKAGLKLNRTTSHKRAMFRNMVTSLFKFDRIRTTTAKAKELRRWADHLITLAKRGDLHARRQALSIVREKAVVHKLFEEATERYGSIAGGYTRVIKLGRRLGDAAPISMVELVVVEKEKKKRKGTKKKIKDVSEAKPTPSKKPEPEKKAVKEDAEKVGKKVVRKKAKPETETKPVVKKKAKTDKKPDEPDVAEKKAVKEDAEKVGKKVARKKAKPEAETKPAVKERTKPAKKSDKSDTTQKKTARKKTPKSEEKD